MLPLHPPTWLCTPRLSPAQLAKERLSLMLLQPLFVHGARALTVFCQSCSHLLKECSMFQVEARCVGNGAYCNILLPLK